MVSCDRNLSDVWDPEKEGERGVYLAIHELQVHI
jgi:hypothetical protein